MARKPEKILRALEGLQEDSLKEVKAFIDSPKKHNGKKRATGRTGDALAKRHLSAIKKWAGRSLKT
ncbi:MAG: hypothetical protein HYT78_07705 [Deltaproteobacteria bacterium]|nr:hypothetical protein [Deltaproteobacteria bacterium]